MNRVKNTRKLKNPDSVGEIIVIGVGNDYRHDDGVGPLIARKLEGKKLPKTLIKVHSGEGISLMESWEGAQTVILLDAVKSGEQPGKIYRFNSHFDSIPTGFFNCSTHDFGVREAVELARAFDRLPPGLIIYGIEGKSFEEGVGLSSEVKKVINDVVTRVMGDVYISIKRTCSIKRCQGGRIPGVT